MKLRESFIAHLPILAVLYLKIAENFDQMNKNTFFSYSLTEMSLMTSSIKSHRTNCHFWILIIAIHAHRRFETNMIRSVKNGGSFNFYHVY